jgi:hypothetical protein
MKNKEIRDYYEQEIRNCRAYLAQNTLRTSLEENKATVMHNSKDLNDAGKTMNEDYLNKCYPAALETLATYELEMDQVVIAVVQAFDALHADTITHSVIQQMLDAIPDYAPSTTFNAILIEYERESECSVSGVVADQPPNTLDGMEYLSFENMENRCMILDLREYLKPIYENEMYDAVIDAFNCDLSIFEHITTMYYALISRSLNKAFSGSEISSALAAKGFQSGGVGYLGEHDCGYRTIFVQES